MVVTILLASHCSLSTSPSDYSLIVDLHHFGEFIDYRAGLQGENGGCWVVIVVAVAGQSIPSIPHEIVHQFPVAVEFGVVIGGGADIAYSGCEEESAVEWGFVVAVAVADEIADGR